MSLNQIAKVTGLLILVTVFLAPFSMLYVPSTLIVPGEAALTVRNLVASEGLFRAGMVSDGLIFLIEIGLTALVYALIKPVSETLALMAACARLAMTVAQGINLFNHFTVLTLLSGTAATAPEQTQALVMLFLNAHESGVYIWGLFFGLHLLLLGALVYQSGYLPRWLGLALLVVAMSYFIQSFGIILFPQFKAAFATIGSLAFIEVVFPLWLLIKGVNPQSAKRAVAYQPA